MKGQTTGSLLVLCLLLGACGEKSTESSDRGAATPTAEPAVQMPSSSEIEAQATVAPKDADDAFERLKREIEADS